MDLQTAEYEARGTPTRSLDISTVLESGFSVKSPTPVPTNGSISSEPTSLPSPVENEPIYIVVTATITPTLTPTLNPYADLHLTLTRIWYIATTATPYAATQIYRPLYDMRSGDCFINCGYITATPNGLIYNP